MDVNEKKICFIICMNDTMYLSECLLYIEQLEIPEGYEVENICITDAESLACAYNGAMAASDAKYKIYLHQDVMIINKHFLYDILEIFNSDKNIGMIGMVGNTILPVDACPWSDNGHGRRIGMVYLDIMYKFLYDVLPNAREPYEEVCVIDGLLMATQYDLDWREDLFKGWDFYDCSQSMEFIKAAYKIVVPHMEKPWFLHDNDISNMSDYEKWRQVFVREYRDIYYKWTDEPL